MNKAYTPKKVDQGAVVKGHEVRGKIWANAHYKGKETEEQIELEVQTFDVEPAWVKASYGLTLNLGNYESARCDAGVTLPTYVEEIEDTFKAAWKMAEEQVQKKAKAIK